MHRNRWIWATVTVICLAVLSVGSAGVVLGTGTGRGPAQNAALVNAATSAPANVEEVPPAVSGPGVNVNNQVILTPLPQGAIATSTSGTSSTGTTTSGTSGASLAASLGYMSESEAVSAARRYVNNPDLTVSAPLLADVTVPSSVPPPGANVPFKTIENVPAWVVTFKSSTPINVAVGGRPGHEVPEIQVQHLSIALNAANGAYLVGFFTR